MTLSCTVWCPWIKCFDTWQYSWKQRRKEHLSHSLPMRISLEDISVSHHSRSSPVRWTSTLLFSSTHCWNAKHGSDRRMKWFSDLFMKWKVCIFRVQVIIVCFQCSVILHSAYSTQARHSGIFLSGDVLVCECFSSERSSGEKEQIVRHTRALSEDDSVSSSIVCWIIFMKRYECSTEQTELHQHSHDEQTQPYTS